MKTSDEKLNDALRAALKRKFDDLEQQPAPSAFSRITDALRQGSTGYYLLTVTIAILFVGVGLIRKERHAEKIAVIEKKPALAKPVTSEVSQSTSFATKKDPIEPASNRASTGTLIAYSETKQPSTHSFSKKKNTVMLDDNVVSNTTIMTQDAAQLMSEAAPILVEKPLSDSVETVIPVMATLQQVAPELLQPVGASKLPTDMDLPTVAVIQNVVKSRPAQTVTMLFNVQTLYTLQRLTIHSPNDTEFRQNLRFGRGLSRESVGYKVSTGFELKGFEYLFSYSHFWQGIYYDAATSNYVVDYSKPDGYSVSREWQGEGGTIHTPYMLAGLGVNKKFTWGKSAGGRNYGKAGVEYSRALNRNQGIWWINASVGREFYLNRNTMVSVGPFAEFTPFKLATGDAHFSIQPYRVGLTMGIGVIPR